MNLKDVIFGNSAAAVHDLGGSYSGSSQEWLPIKDILKGVIITRDKRFVKVLELLPVNFYTLSETEQGNAIADFAAYLKVAPDQLQINVLTQKFNLNGYLKLMKNCLDCEQNESCREMILESMQYVPQLVEREAITHRFFLTFSYEPGMKAANNSPGAIAARLNEQAEVARRYLDRCGISVLEPEYVDNFVLELFYELVNKHTSQHIRLPEGAYDMLGTIHGIYDESVVGTALEQKPENIIALDDTVVQSLLRLKLEDCIIGVGDDTDATSGMKATNHLGSSHNPDYNAILSFSDALLITTESIPSGEMAQLSAKNIQVLVLTAADEGGDGYYTTLLKLWGNYPDELEETTSSIESSLSQAQPAA